MKPIFPLLVSLSLTMTANAQTRPPQDPPTEQRAPVYLSLMGEPFRGVVGGPQPVADWVAVADRDRDGAVGLAEMLEDASRFFNVVDVDGDNVINALEMARYETDIAPARLRFDGGLKPVRSADKSDNTGTLTSDTGARSFRGGRKLFRELDLLEVPQPIMMADSDFNQRVTADEFAKTAAKRFSANDKNKDGLLRPSELTAPMDKRGKPAGPGQIW